MLCFEGASSSCCIANLKLPIRVMADGFLLKSTQIQQKSVGYVPGCNKSANDKLQKA